MARIGTLGWYTTILAAAMLLCGATAADAAWWSGTYYPSTRTAYYPTTRAAYYPTAQAAYYPAQPYYANYGAAYAPAAAAPAVCQTCRPATCGTCVQRVCSYVPQTNYQVAYRDVPVTSYHPVTTVDHCSGCAWTSYRPVTTCTRQAYYVPYTTYRPVCTNVAISTAPAVAYYAAPAVAVAVAPATGSCCGGGAMPAAPATAPSGQMPSGAAPSGSGLPQPAIEPNAEVPNAGGQSILNETQTRSNNGQPAPVQQTNGWRFGGPGPNVSAPKTPSPIKAAPHDRTAMSGDTAAGYRPVSLSKAASKPATTSAIRPAGIVPSGASRAATDADSWQAVR
ncbi:MAG: hypothetical protein WD875_15345 [Pirellulales bacterium]